MDQVRDVIWRLRHSIGTEQAYADWIGRFLLFHGKRHPEERVTVPEQAFLAALAVKGNVASVHI